MKKILYNAFIVLIFVSIVLTTIIPVFGITGKNSRYSREAQAHGQGNVDTKTENAVCVSHSDAVIYIRSQMTKREPIISLYYRSEKPLSIEDVLFYEGSSDNEGDYLRWNIKEYTWNKYDNNRIEINLEYYTTFEQEQQIDSKIAEIGSLFKNMAGFESLSEYQKLVLAYDWVCDNIHYGKNKEEERELTVFDALVGNCHETQCRGFALAYYRIAHVLGVDCRIVVGQIQTEGTEKNHMWNIIRVKRSWYHVDATHGAWKDENNSGTDRYMFFMMPLCFSDVKFSLEYDDEIIANDSYFHTPHEILQYTFDNLIIEFCGNRVRFYLNPVTGIVYIGRYYPLGYNGFALDSAANLRQYEKIIHSIIISNTIKTISTGFFNGFSSAEIIYIPESIEQIGDVCFDNCSPNLIFHCVENSYTHHYLSENGFPFHFYEYTSPIPATCSSMGNSEGLKCATCGDTFPGFDRLPVTNDHISISGGKCLDCGTVIDGLDYGTYGILSHWYLLKSGELVICGEGGIPAPIFLNGQCPWKKYSNIITRIKVMPGITYLGGRLYLNNIADIELPNTLQSIDRGVFSGVAWKSSIDELHLPDGLMWLGKDSFSGSNVKHVFVPKALMREVNDPSFQIQHGSAFAESTLERITFENGVNVIPDQICAQADCLDHIDLPDTVLQIGEKAFQDCSALSTVELPQSLNYIGNAAFQNSGLKTIILPNNLKSIGTSAFENCSSLSAIYIPGNSLVIGANAFGNCPSAVIHCYPNSSAFVYAEENEITCHTKLITLPRTESTCAKKGESEAVYCLSCAKTIVKSKDIPLSEHKDILAFDEIPDSICDCCGKEIPTERKVQEETRLSKRYEEFISSLVKMLKMLLRVLQSFSK